MNNRQAYAFLISLVFIFSNCATNVEKVKTSNHKLSAYIGIPIYIFSTSVEKKFIYIKFESDGILKTDIPSLSHCSQWDIVDGRWDYKLEIVCPDGKYTWDFERAVNYDKILHKAYIPPIIERYYIAGEFELKYLSFRDYGEFLSRNPDIERMLEKEELTTNNHKMFFVIGDENLNKFKKSIGIHDSLILENEQKLLKGYSSAQIIDLRNSQNQLNFILAHQNEIENPDLFFTLTHQYLELKLSEYEKLIKENAKLKTKKYLVFETEFKKNPYDIKNRGFILDIHDEYSGGFKRFFSPPIFVSMDIEKYEELKFNKVVCFAEIEVFTQSETAYISTKYNGILNKENYEKYIVNYQEGLPYIKQQVIRFKQIKLKVLNYRLFNWEQETGDSYWKP
ncbi:hypothetical protein [Leptospira mtsangambouensis]|uniref:hypothetical protein n=1 Tax=Leptospira mtsangambouensis TaxID=2484912 RepID=UPI001EEA6ED7|nr:hypothetical protein [Leptospira mtsangambouensis]MCG6140648.1 hypothetical protein [Leptospira mtsangambouensis]